MPSELATWTCEVCGATAPGTGEEGLWPPADWHTADGMRLVARCASHDPGDGAFDELPSPNHAWNTAF